MIYKYKANIKDEDFRLRQMKASIECLRDKGCWVPAMCLIDSFVNALAPETEDNYESYRKLYGEIFDKFGQSVESLINNILETNVFGFNKGYGIARDDEMDSKYMDVYEEKIFFNADKIVNSFLVYIDKKLNKEE